LYFLGFLALDVILTRLYSLGILNDGEDDQFISGLTVWTVRNAFRGFIHQSELVVYLLVAAIVFFQSLRLNASDIGMV